MPFGTTGIRFYGPKKSPTNPCAVKLLDQPLVIWRSNGNLSAFYDLCIHRGAALSLGWLSGDRLVCAYHGWNYAADGRCTRISVAAAGSRDTRQGARESVSHPRALRFGLGLSRRAASGYSRLSTRVWRSEL